MVANKHKYTPDVSLLRTDSPFSALLHTNNSTTYTKAIDSPALETTFNKSQQHKSKFYTNIHIYIWSSIYAIYRYLFVIFFYYRFFIKHMKFLRNYPVPPISTNPNLTYIPYSSSRLVNYHSSIHSCSPRFLNIQQLCLLDILFSL